jgi:ABC-type transporter Mla maintaining outer membrane lipid asymmetry ATPase subunit MlaF
VSLVFCFDRVRKEHGGLRPLRLASFELASPSRVALLGFDGPAAETCVNLLTGALLPDEGVVRLFDRDTSTMTEPDEWLQTLDRLGLVSVRAVLLDDLTVAQNLAMAFTLSVDPVAADVMDVVRRLAIETGVLPDQLDRRLTDVSRETAARCHLARALAADPELLVLEHANALTVPADAPAFGRDIARIAEARRLAVLALTADEVFGHAVAGRICAVDGATGQVHKQAAWRRWFT